MKNFTSDEIAEMMGADSVCALADVERKLNEYFNGVKAGIDVKMYANIPHLNIEYLDFRPTKTVRHDIEGLLGDVEFDGLHRDFSEAVVKDVLYNLYIEGMEIIVKAEGGRLVDCSLIELVNRALYHASIDSANY